MKKRNIRFLLCGIIQLAFAVSFFFVAAFVNGNLKKQTPSAIEIYDARGLEVSMGQAALFTERGAFAAAGVGEEVQVTDGEGSKSVLAYYQVTTPNYGTYANLHISQGEYFSADAPAKHTVVIPESLSRELFATGNEEKTLYINGMEFAVCGVYEDGDILAQLGSAKIPVVYGNMSGSQDVPVEHLLVGADVTKTAQQQKQETSVMIKTPLEGEMNDLGCLHRLGDSILLLGVFFAGLWFILYLCIFSYRKLISAYECKEQEARRRSRAFFAASVFLLAVIGFVFLLQLVRIPAIYLPENNIFDVSYYGQEILSGIQQINTDCRIRDFSRSCAVYLCAETGLLIVAVAFFWAGCQKLRCWFLDR